MKKLKNAIKRWLLKDEFEELNTMMAKYKGRMEELDTAFRNIDSKYKSVSDLIEVGIDHHVYHEDNNWAVVCIGGKSDYVRFARFSAKDIRDLQNYIRRFESKNVKCDSCLPNELIFNFNDYFKY